MSYTQSEKQQYICMRRDNIERTMFGGCWRNFLWLTVCWEKKNSHKARFLSVLSDSQLIRSSFLSFSALSVSCLKWSIWPLKWSSDVSTVKGKCWLKCPFSKFYILHNPTLLYLLYVLYRCVYFLVCVCWEYSSGSNSVSQAQGEIPTCCSPAKLQLWCLCKN